MDLIRLVIPLCFQQQLNRESSLVASKFLTLVVNLALLGSTNVDSWQRLLLPPLFIAATYFMASILLDLVAI